MQEQILLQKIKSGDESAFRYVFETHYGLLCSIASEFLKDDFKRVMNITYEFFGKRNFRLPTTQTRGRISIAILESVACHVAQTTLTAKHHISADG